MNNKSQESECFTFEKKVFRQAFFFFSFFLFSGGKPRKGHNHLGSSPAWAAWSRAGAAEENAREEVAGPGPALPWGGDQDICQDMRELGCLVFIAWFKHGSYVGLGLDKKPRMKILSPNLMYFNYYLLAHCTFLKKF